MNGRATIGYIRSEAALTLAQESYRQMFQQHLKADPTHKPLLKRRLHRLPELNYHIAIKKLNQQEDK